MDKNNKRDIGELFNDKETVDLVLEDGSEITCDIIGIFEVDENQYIALAEPESINILLYRFKEENDEIFLSNIKSQKEFDEISEVFNELFSEILYGERNEEE